LVFGEVLKSKMSVLGGVDYVAFLIPGLVMMALLQNAFANSASSILQSKIMGSIVFIELPPFSGWQLAAAFISASVARGLIVGAGVFAATCLWSVPPLENVFWVLGFAILGAALMASLGVVCGLWAEKYDQMGAFQSFVIMPLTFLSGVFYSVEQLPDFWAKASLLNPFFYMIDGFRYGFFGRSDFDPFISLFVTGGFCAAAVAIATTLFVTGYKLRH
jgi:ABC-2 type transport system permease protein